MKIIVDSLPRSSEECILKDVCPDYNNCSCFHPEDCDKLICIKSKVYIDDEDVTKDTLRKLGIMSDVIGHDYIIRAITTMRRHPERMETMNIYRDIAECFNSNWSAVERNIRLAISRAYYSFDDAAKNLYYNICGTDKKVSNGAFLRCFCDYVTLKMNGLIN